MFLHEHIIYWNTMCVNDTYDYMIFVFAVSFKFGKVYKFDMNDFLLKKFFCMYKHLSSLNSHDVFFLAKNIFVIIINIRGKSHFLLTCFLIAFFAHSMLHPIFIESHNFVIHNLHKTLFLCLKSYLCLYNTKYFLIKKITSS